MAAQSDKPELSYTWKLTAVLRDEVYKDVELSKALRALACTESSVYTYEVFCFDSELCSKCRLRRHYR